MTGDPAQGREIIFEFVALGDSVRVAAIDVASGEEVVVTGPVATPQSDLERLATRKLMRRLLSQKTLDTKTPRRGGRGVIV